LSRKKSALITMQVLLNKNNKRSKLIGVANVAQLDVLDFLDISEGGLGTTTLGTANALLVSNGTAVQAQSSLAFDGTTLRVNGNGLVSNGASGRVGVGTGTPSGRLSLVGDLPIGNATIDRTLECSFATVQRDSDGFLVPSASNASTIGSWHARTATYGHWAFDPSNPRFAQSAVGNGYVDALMTDHDLVLMIPETLPGNIGVYDVYRKVFLDPVAIDTSGQPYDVAGACLLKSGKVIVAAKTAHFFVVDLAAGTTTIVSATSNVQAIQGQANAYLSGGTLLPDGRVLYAPAVAPRACAFNPNNNTVDFVGPILPESTTINSSPRKFKSSVLLSDGRVCYVPYDSERIVFYNPATDTIQQVTFPLDNPFYDPVTNPVPNTPEKFSSGVLAPNGYVWLVPKKLHYVLALNPQDLSNTKVAASPVGALTDRFCGGVLLPDGRLLLIPSGFPNIVALNVATFVRTEIPIGPAIQKYGGQVFARNGTIVLVPFVGQTRVGLVGPFLPPETLARTQHPFYSASSH